MGNLRDYVNLKWEADCGGVAPTDTLLQTLGIENEIEVGDVIFDSSVTPKKKYECTDATVGASVWKASGDEASGTSGATPFTLIDEDNITLEVNKKYLLKRIGSAHSYILPPTAQVGDVIELHNYSYGDVSIMSNADAPEQQIRMEGNGGDKSSSNSIELAAMSNFGDSMYLVCVTDTVWNVTHKLGNTALTFTGSD